MKKYIIPILIGSLVGTFGLAGFVQAGFGVSPPYITNEHLVPGSHFERTIYLVRGDPVEELTAEVTIDAPEIKDWITIEKGLKFPLPKGVQQFPMKVMIDVPSDVAYGAYHGYIRVRVISSSKKEGQVTTILGARIDIGLVVSEQGFSDFRLRGVSIPDSEKGSPLVVLIMLENTGNTKVRPSKVHLDIYDISHLRLLKSGDITEMGWVKAFETSQIEGELPIDLDLGEYWADVTVYKEGESLGINKLHFRIVPEVEKPEVEEKKEKSFLSLFLPYAGVGIILLVILLVLIWIERKKIKIVFKKREGKENQEKGESDKEEPLS